MDDLILACRENEYEHTGEHDLEDATVYEVKTGSFLLLFWNSSNRRNIDTESVLESIIEKLEEGEMEGSVYEHYQMVEVLFEVHEL